MMLSTNDKIVKSERQVSCELNDEVVILDLNNGIYYELDEVGARVWNMIQEPSTLSEIVNSIVDDYEVSWDECERDVQELIDEIAEKGLVEIKKH